MVVVATKLKSGDWTREIRDEWKLDSINTKGCMSVWHNLTIVII